MNEIESLQNLANNIGLTVKEYFFDDKRKTNKKYFAVNSKGISVSPVLPYEYLNMFLLGWRKGVDNKN